MLRSVFVAKSGGLTAVYVFTVLVSRYCCQILSRDNLFFNTLLVNPTVFAHV